MTTHFIGRGLQHPAIEVLDLPGILLDQRQAGVQALAGILGKRRGHRHQIGMGPFPIRGQILKELRHSGRVRRFQRPDQSLGPGGLLPLVDRPADQCQHNCQQNREAEQPMPRPDDGMNHFSNRSHQGTGRARIGSCRK